MNKKELQQRTREAKARQQQTAEERRQDQEQLKNAVRFFDERLAEAAENGEYETTVRCPINLRSGTIKLVFDHYQDFLVSMSKSGDFRFSWSEADEKLVGPAEQCNLLPEQRDDPYLDALCNPKRFGE